MNTTGTIEDISIDYISKKTKITLMLEGINSVEGLKEIKNDKLSIDIKKHRDKRSLKANRYFWELLQEICELQELNPIEEYKRRVKELGIFRITRVETKDVEAVKKSWKNWGTAWFCEISDTEYLGNVEFKILHLYYGSSSFNSKQMSRLINDLVQDCKAVGIETKTEAEIKSLLEQWH